MAKEFKFETDIQEITGCPRYRDSEVSLNSHYFCVDCSEKLVEGVSLCPLCRPFFIIPDNRHDGVPRDYLVDNLVDLHGLFVERSLNITGEKRFDTSLVEQFGITDSLEFAQVAWLENKIYAIEVNVKRVRVFEDRAPFDELPEGIEIDLGVPNGMTACAASRSIFISDVKNLCIWKIQMPNRELIRWDIHPGAPASLSITPDIELLAVVYEDKTDYDDDYDDDDDEDDEDDDEEDDDDDDDDDDEDDVKNEEAEENNAEDNEEHFRVIYRLQIYRHTDGSLTRSMRLPNEVQHVVCAAELPNKTFVISHAKSIIDDHKIGILSTDGESLRFIRTLDLGFFETIKLEPWKLDNFVVKDDGEIFFVDYIGRRVFWFNSKLTDYRIISSNDCRLIRPSVIVYIKEKQQLMVCGDKFEAPASGGPGIGTRVAVFHLSPCSLANERSKTETVTSEN